MNDYFQPDFYRFNEDSLQLVDWIKKYHQGPHSSILDLGAGSGVLGIELANFYQSMVVDFLEIQNDFIFYLEKNIGHILNKKTQTQVHLNSFANWRPERTWDIIVVNPPYYLKGHGELSKDPRRAMARSFIQDDWRDLWTIIACTLGPKGTCYIVIKDDPKIYSELTKRLDQTQLGIKKKIEKGLCFLELFRLNID